MNRFTFRWPRAPSAKHVRWIALALLGTVAIACLVWLAWPKHRITYNVTLRTEWLEFLNHDASPASWEITDAEVFDTRSGQTRPFTGYYEPADSVRVTLERVSYGPLVIEVQSVRPESSNARSSVGTLVSEDGNRLEAGDYLSILIPDIPARADSGSTILLPLVGDVARGGRPLGRRASGSPAILRSGTVRLLGRSLFSGRIFGHPLFSARTFEAGSTELGPGDVIEVHGTQWTDPAVGFVAVNEAPGMLATYRAIGTEAWVQRAGGGRHAISISLFTRLVHDPFFGFISFFSAVVVLVSGVVTILLFVRELDRPMS